MWRTRAENTTPTNRDIAADDRMTAGGIIREKTTAFENVRKHQQETKRIEAEIRAQNTCTVNRSTVLRTRCERLFSAKIGHKIGHTERGC